MTPKLKIDNLYKSSTNLIKCTCYLTSIENKSLFVKCYLAYWAITMCFGLYSNTYDFYGTNLS